MSVLVASQLSAQGSEPIVLRAGSVTAVAWPAQRALARNLAEVAARPADWPGLGRTAPGPLTLIVAPDEATVDSITRGRAPAWGVGFADPGSRTILLRADAPDVHRTLRHELAHLALHDRVRVRVPLWFDEGYAGWAAGEWQRLGGLALNLTVARGAVPELSALDGELRRSPGSVGPAYALAMSAVLELARRHPDGSLEPLLDRLAEGEEFETAVRATTGLPLTRFEDAWRRAVRARYTIATWLVAGGAWALVAAGVLGLGVWRRRHDRIRRAALDEGWTIPEEDEPGAEPPVLDRDPRS
ncbi:MAG: peptidase MA family metallohydrolase [Gemmatimonadales bacterium]